ncbi:MAG: phosphoribosylglycinamide formyltransferase [Flavobacteriales bacterium]|nr:phosphoribosylglycinamide formyltransferase [Flavobacteriales bacterium]
MAAGSMKVAILASGEGTNAERLIRAAEKRSDIEIEVVASNRAGAGVLRRAESLGARTWVFSKAQLNGGSVAQELAAQGVQFVVLMGFLLKVPGQLAQAFSGRILNLHPSLLPAFGGKGMYGDHVHKAVHSALQEGLVNETGITLHWVDEEYDTGAVFFQARVALDAALDTPSSIAEKVRNLEAEHCAREALRAVTECLSLS